MYFIERIFHISPDGGDGSTELLYLAALLFIVALFRWRSTVLPIVKRMLERLTVR